MIFLKKYLLKHIHYCTYQVKMYHNQAYVWRNLTNWPLISFCLMGVFFSNLKYYLCVPGLGPFKYYVCIKLPFFVPPSFPFVCTCLQKRDPLATVCIFEIEMGGPPPPPRPLFQLNSNLKKINSLSTLLYTK